MPFSFLNKRNLIACMCVVLFAYLFIYYSFKHVLSTSENINSIGMMVNNELQRIQKEAA
jgi:TRAP-type C4-dicarboxylate transport system permease small subunit